MAERMLKFVALGQAMPEKRPAELRAKDFEEIYRQWVEDNAQNQAGRCSQCGVPFCQIHCPLQNDIPDWLRLAAEGRWQEAYELSSATSTMPEICGRICPQDRLCEGNCVIEKGFRSVTIGAVEKHITDLAWERGWVSEIEPMRERGESIGIVGAGPAGLAAADRLRTLGYKVTVYDRHDRAGGLLIYGIPNFKLDKGVVARRVARLERAGVVFRLGFELGKDATLADLRARHDAVLLAIGTYHARELKAPGVGLENVIEALPYLIHANRVGLGDSLPERDMAHYDARGRRVLVIGGGDTAMDCVRTAIRQQAKSVTCLYRRDRDNMPGSAREVAHAEEEGVRFEWLTAPEAFLGRRKVTAVRAHRMRLGPPDASGRQSPEPVPDSHMSFEADLVILALGFEAEDIRAQCDAPALETTRAGTIRLRRGGFMTSIDGVFAAGDIVRGASLVVWAVRDGQDAAVAIHRWISASAASRGPARDSREPVAVAMS
ncbi:MAG: NAD(P)-dependent oxidoreductase [Rhodothalassiaceae bacterium]